MKPGTGKKLIVCKALSKTESVSQDKIDSLDNQECDYHLHLAFIHNAATKKVSDGFCDSSKYVYDYYEKQRAKQLDDVKSICRDSFS